MEHKSGWDTQGNIIDFDSEALSIDNKVESRYFINLVDKRLVVVIWIWKDSKVLQTVSTDMKLGCKEVQRRNDQSVLHVSVTCLEFASQIRFDRKVSCLTYFYLTRFPTAKSEFQTRFETRSRYSHSR